MAEKQYSRPSGKGRGAGQQSWPVYILDTLLSIVPGTRSLRSYLFGPQRRKARRKQRRRTSKTLIRKVVAYLPRNKAGDVRFFRSGAQPAQFYKAAPGGRRPRTHTDKDGAADDDNGPHIANLRDVALARPAADEPHEFTANRICATAPKAAAVAAAMTPETSRPLTPESDLDDLADILAALAVMITDDATPDVQAQTQTPAAAQPPSPKVRDQQKAAEQLAALLGGIMA